MGVKESMLVAWFNGPRGLVFRSAVMLVAILTGLGPTNAAPTFDSGPGASVPTVLGDPPADPFLRIETGMHGATINRVSVDAAGRLAVTASDDKTARLWSLPDGKLVGTLRVPIGPGLDGSLYSVALSPDGKTVAATGVSGKSWSGGQTLYLFDVVTQKFKARFPKLPSEILHLAFSPDGARLAMAFGAGAGLRVYEIATGRMIGEDHEYGRQSANWVAFDSEGRIATTSFDGFVRLYEASVMLVTKAKVPGSGRPYSVAFSPDGGLLAVGSFDKPKVDLLSATDLAPRFSPDTSDLKTGNLQAVAWLNDGRQVTLAAGGTASKTPGEQLIRVWGNSGMGRPVDIPAAKDAINQIESVGKGEALFVSAEPSWGRINAAKKLFERTSNLANFRDIHAGRFAISDDALTLEFGISKKGQRPMSLALADQSYGPAGRPNPSLATPIIESPGIKVTGWQNTANPMVGGRKLILDGEELARSLAIAPDGRSFLLGSDYWLRLYDAKGNQLAKTAVSASVAGVVINRPGTMAAAALTDGTIHWFNLGRSAPPLDERATLFVHADGLRWVAWTPEGFFEHAENGGKDLVGYHFNKGEKKPPEFINFAQVYSVFHSSELLIKKILGGSDPDIARTYAAIGDLRLRFEQRPLPGIDVTEYCWTPPSVQETGAQEICRPITDITTRGFARDTSRQAGAAPATSPPMAATAPTPSTASPGSAVTAVLGDNITDVKLKFKVVDRGGGVGDIAVFLNDRNINRQDATRAFRRDTMAAPSTAALPSEIFERRIALEPGANQIEIRVYDGTRTAFATSRKVEVARAAPVITRDIKSRASVKPRLFVLAAGVDRYKRPEFRLRFPVADAVGVVASLRARVDDLYQAVMVPTVTPSGDVVFSDSNIGQQVLA
ncbi:MAG: hypothetical protein WCK65_12375, partial [Rhodospirillaceae bacterium]